MLAPSNMLVRPVTEAVFQLLKGWLKLVANWNVQPMSVTRATFQLLMFWLNELAALNMYPILARTCVFQLMVPETPAASPLLKAVALANMLYIEVTLDTLRLEMSWLKTVAPENM